MTARQAASGILRVDPRLSSTRIFRTSGFIATTLAVLARASSGVLPPITSPATKMRARSVADAFSSRSVKPSALSSPRLNTVVTPYIA